jgi:hypothetical protein
MLTGGNKGDGGEGRTNVLTNAAAEEDALEDAGREGEGVEERETGSKDLGQSGCKGKKLS